MENEKKSTAVTQEKPNLIDQVGQKIILSPVLQNVIKVLKASSMESAHAAKYFMNEKKETDDRIWKLIREAYPELEDFDIALNHETGEVTKVFPSKFLKRDNID